MAAKQTFTEEQVSQLVTVLASCSSSSDGSSRPVWDQLPIHENPLFRVNHKLALPLSEGPVHLKHTWIPYKDTPLSSSVSSTRDSRGLLAVLACKKVQEECKLLRTFAVCVAGNCHVQKLESSGRGGPRKHGGFAFLQSSLANSKFETFGLAEPKGHTLIVTTESYLALLAFFSNCWPAVTEKVKETMDRVDSGTMVAEIFPGVMLSGDGRFVISSVVLEEFDTFSLLLDVSANSRCPRGREISASLRYTDESLHHESQRDSRGMCKFVLPLRAVIAQSKNFRFFENVLLGDSGDENSVATPELQKRSCEVTVEKALPTPPALPEASRLQKSVETILAEMEMPLQPVATSSHAPGESAEFKAHVPRTPGSSQQVCVSLVSRVEPEPAPISSAAAAHVVEREKSACGEKGKASSKKELVPKRAPLLETSVEGGNRGQGAGVTATSRRPDNFGDSVHSQSPPPMKRLDVDSYSSAGESERSSFKRSPPRNWKEVRERSKDSGKRSKLSSSSRGKENRR